MRDLLNCSIDQHRLLDVQGVPLNVISIPKGTSLYVRDILTPTGGTWWTALLTDGGSPMSKAFHWLSLAFQRVQVDMSEIYSPQPKLCLWYINGVWQLVILPPQAPVGTVNWDWLGHFDVWSASVSDDDQQPWTWNNSIGTVLGD